MASSTEWELIYWPGFGGRGEYIRLMFAAAGVEWKETKTAEEIRDMCHINPESQLGFPILAPPILKRGSFQLCQTPTILKYLGEEFNMAPTNSVDVALADQMNQCVVDFISEGRHVFHPVKNTASYKDQIEEAKPYIKAFEEERLGRYLKYFERCLKFTASNSNGFAIGNSLTYADIALFQAIRAAQFQFPAGFKAATPDIPNVLTHMNKILSLPKIKAYIESPRYTEFCGDSMM